MYVCLPVCLVVVGRILAQCDRARTRCSRRWKICSKPWLGVCVRACVPACVRGCVRVLQFTHINIEGMSCRKQRHDSFNGVPSIKYLKKRKL